MILTVFFSMKGETIAPGMKIVNLDKGNTAWAAGYVHNAAGGDLFELETEKTYTKDHMKMIYEAQEELREGIRPRLRSLPQGFDQYDTVFLGFPNWWEHCPCRWSVFLNKKTGGEKESFPLSPVKAAVLPTVFGIWKSTAPVR